MGFNVAARTHVGLVRKLNEDAMLARPGGALWAVSDGMGGHEAGEVASARVIGALEALPAAGSAADARHLSDLAMAALQGVNAELLALSRRHFDNRTIGSTVVAIVADRNGYVCFWVGDSRAYLLRGGLASQLTRDHSLVQDLVDAGILDAAEAESHPNSNVITRAVGVQEQLRIDTVSGELMAGDTFLIASDGLTRLVPAESLVRELGGGDIEAACDRLLALALAEGAPDNVTFVVIRYEGEDG